MMVLRILTSSLLKGNLISSKFKISKRHHGRWNYRSATHKPSKVVEDMATGVMGVAWWWVLWHVFRQYDHIIGEFAYPIASKWTDEELGIPPDDDDGDNTEVLGESINTEEKVVCVPVNINSKVEK